MNRPSPRGAAHFEARIGQRIGLQADPRSVQAMLAGRDDARTRLFERFAEKVRAHAPYFDAETVDGHYRRLELGIRVKVNRLPRQWQPRRALAVARAPSIADSGNAPSALPG